MAKFKYKFESVRNVKEIFQKKIQKEVAEIEMQIDEYNQYYLSLINDLESIKKNFIKRHMTVAELKFQENYEMSIQRKLHVLKKHINELEEQKNQKLKVLAQKTKEKKIFDELEVNYLEAYNIEQSRIESIRTDEMANQRFIRQAK